MFGEPATGTTPVVKLPPNRFAAAFGHSIPRVSFGFSGFKRSSSVAGLANISGGDTMHKRPCWASGTSNMIIRGNTERSDSPFAALRSVTATSLDGAGLEFRHPGIPWLSTSTTISETDRHGRGKSILESVPPHNAGAASSTEAQRDGHSGDRQLPSPPSTGGTGASTAHDAQGPPVPSTLLTSPNMPAVRLEIEVERSSTQPMDETVKHEDTAVIIHSDTLATIPETSPLAPAPTRCPTIAPEQQAQIILEIYDTVSTVSAFIDLTGCTSVDAFLAKAAAAIDEACDEDELASAGQPKRIETVKVKFPAHMHARTVCVRRGNAASFEGVMRILKAQKDCSDGIITVEVSRRRIVA